MEKYSWRKRGSEARCRSKHQPQRSAPDRPWILHLYRFADHAAVFGRRDLVRAEESRVGFRNTDCGLRQALSHECAPHPTATWPGDFGNEVSKSDRASKCG